MFQTSCQTASTVIDFGPNKHLSSIKRIVPTLPEIFSWNIFCSAINSGILVKAQACIMIKMCWIRKQVKMDKHFCTKDRPGRIVLSGLPSFIWVLPRVVPCEIPN